MRVIAGSARGIRLEAPPGLDIRPTLDRVREALFSILMPRLDGAHFLDLFAGTGANGIEALSRGATSATFVDSEARPVETIRKNMAAARVAENGRIRRLALPGGLAALAADGIRYDIVFADPPYAFEEYTPLLQALRDAPFLADDAIVIIEHHARRDPLDGPQPMERYRKATYGETALSFFRKATQQE